MIPHSALLRAAEGDFVYVVNGNHLTRTAVKAGADAGDFMRSWMAFFLATKSWSSRCKLFG